MKIINNFTDFINEAKTPPKDIVTSLLSKNVERGATLPEQNSAFSKAKMIIHNNGFTRHDFRMFSDDILDLVFGKKNKSENTISIDGFDFKKIKIDGIGELLVDDSDDLLDKLLKSTRILLNDDDNNFPMRIFTDKIGKLHYSWMMGDNSGNSNVFFFNDDIYNESNLEGCLIIKSVRDGIYRSRGKEIKIDNQQYILYIMLP